MTVRVDVLASENHIGEVGGQTVYVDALVLTRPADTTAYAASDVVCDSTTTPHVLLFKNVARKQGGSGTITSVRVVTSQAANVAQYRIHFYHIAPLPIADNAQYTSLWIDRDRRIGFVDVGPVAQEGTGSTMAEGMNTTDLLPFVCAPNSRDIIAVCETKTAFTPDSAQTFYFAITADVN